MPGNVFVDSSAPFESAASFLFEKKEMCAQEVPPLHRTKPCFQAQGDLMKQIRTLKASITNPRVPRNVPIWNLCFAVEASPQNYMVGLPKNHISDLQFEKSPYAPQTGSRPCLVALCLTEIHVVDAC